MKKFIQIFLVSIIAIPVFAQVSYTPNLNLAQPPQGYIGWATMINNNWSILDTSIAALQLSYQGAWSSSFTYSKGQLATYSGALYQSTTNSNLNNVPGSGSAWVLMVPAASNIALQTNGTNNTSQSSLNFTNSSTIAFTNPSGGSEQGTVLNSPAVGGITVTGTPSTGFVPTATSATAATWQAITSINGVSITGTPSAGYVPTATSATAATWQPVAAGGCTTADCVITDPVGNQIITQPNTTQFEVATTNGPTFQQTKDGIFIFNHNTASNSFTVGGSTCLSCMTWFGGNVTGDGSALFGYQKTGASREFTNLYDDELYFFGSYFLLNNCYQGTSFQCDPANINEGGPSYSYNVSTSGSITVTLPSACPGFYNTGSGGDGSNCGVLGSIGNEASLKYFYKVDSSTNTVTISPAVGETIYGFPSGVVLSKQYQGVELLSNGNNGWYVIGTTNPAILNGDNVFTGTNTFSNPIVSGGTQSISGCSLTGAVGGSAAGSFSSGVAGTCTVTITPGITAPHGFRCSATDLTTSADAIQQTATTTTSCTIAGTTATADVITWQAIAF